MSLKYAILGFLAYQPMSGYDLKKAFDTSVQHFWPANQSQIYRTLRQLHDEGLLTREIDAREDHLDRKVYEVTDAGKADLLDWLSTPLPLTETRDPFLMQLYFASFVDDETAENLVRSQLEQVEADLATLVELHHVTTPMVEGNPNRRGVFYSMLTLEFGLALNTAYIAWLRGILARIEARTFDVRSMAGLIGPADESE